MIKLIKTLAAVAAGTLLVTSPFALSATEARGPSAFVPIENEAPPELIVDAPLPGPLARGAVLIPYRVQNFRILPLLGAAALDVSPRVGHLHVTVDGASWHWVHATSDPVVITPFSPGEHTVELELAGADHQRLDSRTVRFTVLTKTVPTSEHAGRPAGHER